MPGFSIAASEDGSLVILKLNDVEVGRFDQTGRLTTKNVVLDGGLDLSLLAQKIHAGSGYQRLPGGLILQWGYGTSNSSGLLAVTFPMAFPVQCLYAGGGSIHTNGGVSMHEYDGETTRFGAQFRTFSTGTGSNNPSTKLRWFSLGI